MSVKAHDKSSLSPNYKFGFSNYLKYEKIVSQLQIGFSNYDEKFKKPNSWLVEREQ